MIELRPLTVFVDTRLLHGVNNLTKARVDKVEGLEDVGAERITSCVGVSNGLLGDRHGLEVATVQRRDLSELLSRLSD